MPPVRCYLGVTETDKIPFEPYPTQASLLQNRHHPKGAVAVDMWHYFMSSQRSEEEEDGGKNDNK